MLSHSSSSKPPDDVDFKKTVSSPLAAIAAQARASSLLATTKAIQESAILNDNYLIHANISLAMDWITETTATPPSLTFPGRLVSAF